jgi:hypothetical protein
VHSHRTSKNPETPTTGKLPGTSKAIGGNRYKQNPDVASLIRAVLAQVDRAMPGKRTGMDVRARGILFLGERELVHIAAIRKIHILVRHQLQ